MIDFKDKKVLITGATGGIGKEIVKKFVSLKANILATGTKTEKLEALKKEFPNINVLKFDISEQSKINEFIENKSFYNNHVFFNTKKIFSVDIDYSYQFEIAKKILKN